MIVKGVCSISCFVTIVYEVQISSTPRTLNTLSKNRRFLAKNKGDQKTATSPIVAIFWTDNAVWHRLR